MFEESQMYHLEGFICCFSSGFGHRSHLFVNGWGYITALEFINKQSLWRSRRRWRRKRKRGKELNNSWNQSFILCCLTAAHANKTLNRLRRRHRPCWLPPRHVFFFFLYIVIPLPAVLKQSVHVKIATCSWHGVHCPRLIYNQWLVLRWKNLFHMSWWIKCKVQKATYTHQQLLTHSECPLTNMNPHRPTFWLARLRPSGRLASRLSILSKKQAPATRPCITEH